MATTTSGESASRTGRAGTAGHGGATERGWSRSRGTAFAVLVLANTLWAGTYTAGKVALQALSPVELNALRFSLAGLVLLPVLLRGWRRIPLTRETLPVLAQAVVLGFILNKAFEYFGLNLSTASDVALLISTESLFTALLSWTVLRERATGRGIAALAIGLVGVYLVVERGLAPNLGGGGSNRVVGDLLVILSLLLEAGYTIRGKATLERVPPLLFVSVTLLGSLLVWIPAGLLTVAHSGMPTMRPETWIAVAYMAFIATVTGYWLWFRALRDVDASAAAPTLFIQPLLGAALAIWLLHDVLSWATVAGGALILVSLLVVVRSQPATQSGATAVPAADDVGFDEAKP